MVDTGLIREHIPEVGSDGGRVGALDHIDGQRIKLVRTDPAAHDVHHVTHVGSIEVVEDSEVRPNRMTAHAQDGWGVSQSSCES